MEFQKFRKGDDKITTLLEQLNPIAFGIISPNNIIIIRAIIPIRPLILLLYNWTARKDIDALVQKKIMFTIRFPNKIEISNPLGFFKKNFKRTFVDWLSFFNFSISSFESENIAVSDPEKKAEIVKDISITKIDIHSDNQKSNIKCP